MSNKNLLELFSGTHSFGKVFSKNDFKVYSLDRDLPKYDKLDPKKKYKSFKHFEIDIMNFDYKQFEVGFFHTITASPVCLWWSNLRNTWIGRKMKNKITGKLNDKPFTKEDLQKDINLYGKPMVDKVREIIDYLKPKYFIIENPKSSKMKNYITDLKYYDVDYCKYCDFGYQKRTRFWTNLKGFKPKLCKKDCDNIIILKKQKLHKSRMGTSKTIQTKDGKIIRVNTKALREKYKDYDNIQIKKGHKYTMGGRNTIGGSNNRLERYRIPPKLIQKFIDCMDFNKMEKCPNQHYTPQNVAEELIKDIKFNKNDFTLEPCKADGSFYNIIPYKKDWCEIDLGRDIFKYDFGDIKFTKIITNPPYRSNHKNAKDRKNIFMKFIMRCFELCDGECWFLFNNAMLNGLTPPRLRKIKDLGFNLCFMRIINIKKWYGRYYWICFSKSKKSIIFF
tara:strand:- start:1337 stop:2680 length:1344 start_codon:yes stop_codon:yes gene_type:complete